MITIGYVLQALLAIVFFYSGVSKLFLSREKLVVKGQTGVANIPQPLIRFIGIAEIVGVIGLVLPDLMETQRQIVVLAAVGLAFIMIPAAWIHYNRNERGAVGFNLVLFALCCALIYIRLKVVG